MKQGVSARLAMSRFGWVFFLAGLGFLIAALAAPSGEAFARTVSFDLMLNKIIYGLVGLSGAITGAVWIAAGMIGQLIAGDNEPGGPEA